MICHAVDDVDLERLSQPLEERAGVVARHHLGLEGDALPGQVGHACLDAAEVVLTEGGAVGQPEVVEEAVGDRRPDVVLSAGEELHDRGRHQVGGAVPEDIEADVRRCQERQAGLSSVVDLLVGHAAAF